MGPSVRPTQNGFDSPQAPERSGVRIMGVPVRLHFTFVLFALFLIASGAAGGQSAVNQSAYILAIFASVVLHELGHARSARLYGIGTTEIVLYPIGGIARLERTPKPAEEFWIALAGPAVNVLIAVVLFASLALAGIPIDIASLSDPEAANVFARIAAGNLILAVFNMIPAFPMDGGRVLRAVLARFTGEEIATRRAALAGRIFAVFMAIFAMASGMYTLVFIAVFIYLGAVQESFALSGRKLMEGVPVSAAMITEYRTLSHGSTLRDAAAMVLATSQRNFPITFGEQVIGLLGHTDLLRGLEANGPDTYVAGIMDRAFRRVAPGDSLTESIPMISNTFCALVMEGERLVGLLTRENVGEFLRLRKFVIGATRV